MRQPTVSVLMTTYAGERAENLASALQSIYTQTVPALELILVIDGPISESQEAVIRTYPDDRRPPLTLLRLPTNMGLAAALNAGMEFCHGDWVIRMDSDDIATADRIETQLAYVKANPDIDIVSAWAEEFSDDEPLVRLKSPPVLHDDILRLLRWRNCLVHPTVMIRTRILLAVNGYRGDFGRLEDYDLFVRLAIYGARFGVIPKVLLRFRIGRAQLDRRGGLLYCLNDLRFRRFCRSVGFLTFSEYITSSIAYAAFRLAGSHVRGTLYRLVRTPIEKATTHA